MPGFGDPEVSKQVIFNAWLTLLDIMLDEKWIAKVLHCGALVLLQRHGDVLKKGGLMASENSQENN